MPTTHVLESSGVARNGPSRARPDHSKIYNINNISLFQVASYTVSSYQFCTDRYCALSATCQLRCSVHVRSSHVRTQNSHAKTASRPVAGKRRLKQVRVSIHVFYAKYSANSLRASALRAGGGKFPPPAPTPLVGPTNLQILATPLFVVTYFLGTLLLCYTSEMQTVLN